MKRLFLFVCAVLLLAAAGCETKRSGDYYDEYRYERGQVSDQEDWSHQEKVDEQKEIIRRQEEEIKRQDRELEDLRRQKYHNQYLRRFDSRR